MKRILLMVTLPLLLATPSLASNWHFVADLEGGAEYRIFYSETGQMSFDHSGKNEIIISKLPDGMPLNADGSCTLDNCQIQIYLNGRSPEPHEEVDILFSNGFHLNFKHNPNAGQILLSNFYTSSAGATNQFVDNIGKAEWVDIRFGQTVSYRFDLKGSSAALDAILPHLAE